MHAVHEMQPIVTDVRGVCSSVCHAAQLGFTVQKRLNGSRSCLKCPRDTVLHGVRTTDRGRGPDSLVSLEDMKFCVHIEGDRP